MGAALVVAGIGVAAAALGVTVGAPVLIVGATLLALGTAIILEATGTTSIIKTGINEAIDAYQAEKARLADLGPRPSVRGAAHPTDQDDVR